MRQGFVALRRQDMGWQVFIGGMSLLAGAGAAIWSFKVAALVLAGYILAFLISVPASWQYVLWFVLWGLALWSYGFNNIPAVRPLPLVDALTGYVVVASFPMWWRFRRVLIVKRLLVLLFSLLLVVVIRLIVDSPVYGLLAVRDALFAFELWTLLPALAMGWILGKSKLNKYLSWLFISATLWFLLYPWREWLMSVSPIVGVQRPVPLLAFTTVGFLAVPGIFWFLGYPRNHFGVLGVAALLLVLLFVQGRGPYLALFLSVVVASLLHREMLSKWVRVGMAGGLVMLALALTGPLPGRLGAPVGLRTVTEQIATLAGKEGPGEGSFRQRIRDWPRTAAQVLEEPLGPFVGIGLGRDIFEGFTIKGGVLVRKPHNDFLEIWARTGVVGFIPWFGILFILGMSALAGARRDPRDNWVLALQITLWITAFSQPAFGFAYITVVWADLTALWLGADMREQGITLFIEGRHASVAHSHPLPPTRR